MNIQQIHLKIHTGIMINLKKKNIYILSEYNNIRTSRDVLSLQNITFLQSAIVQCLYILQNNILFFIMTLVIRGFLAVGDMAFSDPFADSAG